jgi:N-acetylglutamate synthase-like GNAT family acetyltransferase
MTRFQADALVMADDRDIDADTCADTRVVRNEDNACPTWIAENSEGIVGVITLAVSGQWLARVGGLWVDPSLRDSRVPDDLLRQALRFCRDAGILKVVLRTHLPGDEAWTVFHNCGFSITRDRQREGRNVRDFYLDLYKRPECEQPETG